MPAIIFFGLLSLSLAGVACSFFFSGIAFMAVLAVSLAFPLASLFKGLSVIIKRKMIMSFIVEEIRNSTRETSKNMAYRYAKASNAVRQQKLKSS